MSRKLSFLYGAMNSSKTMRLLATAYNFEEKGIHFICLKSAIDDRDGVGVIHSRIGIERKCEIIDNEANLFELIKNIKEKDFELKKVLVDECQFLTSLQVDQLAKAVDELDVDVMCYGLRTDFLTESFDGSRRLFEVADTIEEVKSHCSCGNKAMMNARFDEQGYLVLSGSKIEIGGNDRYTPLCRKCYYKEGERTLERNKSKLIEKN